MGLFSRIRGPSAAHPSGVANATDAPSVHTPLRKTRSILHRAASASPRVTRKPVSSSLDRADSAAGSQGASAVNKRHSVPGAGLHRLFSVRRSHRRRQQDAPAQKSSDMLEPVAQSPAEEDPEPAASPNPVLDDPPKLPSLDMGGNNVQSSSPALLEGESAGRETPSNQLPAQPSVASLFSQRAVQDLRLRDPGLDSVHAETARKQYELQSFLKQRRHWQPTFSQPSSPAAPSGRASLSTAPASTLNQPIHEARRPSDESLGKLFNFDKDSSGVPFDLRFSLSEEREPSKISTEAQDERKKRRLSRRSSPCPASESRISTIHLPWRHYRKPSSHASTTKGKDKSSVPSKSFVEKPQEEDLEVNEEPTPELGLIPHVSLSGSLVDFVFKPSVPETPQPGASTYVPTVPLQNFLNEQNSHTLQPTPSQSLPRVPSGRRPVPHSAPVLLSTTEALSPQTTGEPVAVSLKEGDDAVAKRLPVSVPKSGFQEVPTDDQATVPAVSALMSSKPITQKAPYRGLKEEGHAPSPQATPALAADCLLDLVATDVSEVTRPADHLPRSTILTDSDAVGQPGRSVPDLKTESVGTDAYSEDRAGQTTASHGVQAKEAEASHRVETPVVAPTMPAVQTGKEAKFPAAVPAPLLDPVRSEMKSAVTPVVQSAQTIQAEPCTIAKSAAYVPERSIDVEEQLTGMPNRSAGSRATSFTSKPSSEAADKAAEWTLLQPTGAKIDPQGLAAGVLGKQFEPTVESGIKDEPVSKIQPEIEVEAKLESAFKPTTAIEPNTVIGPKGVLQPTAAHEPKDAPEPHVSIKPKADVKAKEWIGPPMGEKVEKERPTEVKAKPLPSVLARAPAAIREAYLSDKAPSSPPHPRPAGSGSRVAAAALRFQSSGGTRSPVKKFEQKTELLSPSPGVENATGQSSVLHAPTTRQAPYLIKPAEEIKHAELVEESQGSSKADKEAALVDFANLTTEAAPDAPTETLKPRVTEVREGSKGGNALLSELEAGITSDKEAKPTDRLAAGITKSQDLSAEAVGKPVYTHEPSEQTDNPLATGPQHDYKTATTPSIAGTTQIVDTPVEIQSNDSPKSNKLSATPKNAHAPPTLDGAQLADAEEIVGLTLNREQFGQTHSATDMEEPASQKAVSQIVISERETATLPSPHSAEVDNIMNTQASLLSQSSAIAATIIGSQVSVESEPDPIKAAVKSRPEDFSISASTFPPVSETFAEKDTEAVDTVPDARTKTVVDVATLDNVGVRPPAATASQTPEVEEVLPEKDNTTKKLNDQGMPTMKAPAE